MRYDGDIFNAASKGHLGVVQYFIEKKGNDINSKDSSGLTLLDRAASNGRLNIVKYLVDKGVDVNYKNNSQFTALDYAAYNGDGNLNVVKYLIEEKGARYNGDIFKAAEKGYIGLIKYFIEEKGNDVNSKDSLGWTPLHRAAYNGRLNLVKYLVDEKHADVNAKNNVDWAPLHAAAEKGHLDILKYLISKGVDVNLKAGNVYTPLEYAAINGHSNITKYLIEEKGVSYNVFDAVKSGYLYQLSLLASQIGDIAELFNCGAGKRSNKFAQSTLKQSNCIVYFIAQNVLFYI